MQLLSEERLVFMASTFSYGSFGYFELKKVQL